ncbi:hypothetical protein QJS10_CPA06g02314 [Acorus calamus]|uniref:Uncharacterized protein n=1 Tax=Acorus calamus TaxID=4465 RepID=A0AAV9EJ42_ACOCL|nr:hypothetical protein QJS10_CPA06g02322 [Acorus calamus]KAK1314097.1 hypothetical protein QJS10_CPA06g02314 [Acorus calamus]
MEESTVDSNPNGDAPKGTTDGLRPIEINGSMEDDKPTLYGLLRKFIHTVVSADSSAPLLQRVKTACADGGPRVREASRNTARDLLVWTRRGGTLRALLVISVGTITLLALTGFMVFMLFFLAATINAIVISLLMSLAAAGGFLALFFACLTAIYIGALSVALFVISTTTITTIIAVVVATGWVGFLWTVWLAARKSMDLTKHSLNMTGSAISAYSAALQARRR